MCSWFCFWFHIAQTFSVISEEVHKKETRSDIMKNVMYINSTVEYTMFCYSGDNRVPDTLTGSKLSGLQYIHSSNKTPR